MAARFLTASGTRDVDLVAGADADTADADTDDDDDDEDEWSSLENEEKDGLMVSTSSLPPDDFGGGRSPLRP